MITNVAIMSGFFFAAAGRLDQVQAWAYLTIYLAVLAVFRPRMDAGMLAERRRSSLRGEDPGFSLAVSALMPVHWLTAGFELARGGPSLSRGLVAAALAVFASGPALLFWAMTVNRFYSPVVSVQVERGHHVVCDGPYKRVRHPGYFGLLLVFASSGLALGSLWSIVPTAVLAALTVRRVIRKDRYLSGHLKGYARYAEEVRWRLAPGLW